jgi:DNA-binding MarR family transcriptional regulator
MGYIIITEQFINVTFVNICIMQLNDRELITFLERVFTFRTLPLWAISSKTIRDLNLDESQVMAFIKVVQTPNETFVSTVAETMFMSTPKASRLIDSLVQSQLITRVYDTLKDRRKIQLAPTQEGLTTFNNIRNEVVQTVKELFGDTEHVQVLSENLDIFNECLLVKMKKLHSTNS